MSTSQLRCQGPQRQAFGRLANATTLRVISRPGTGHRVSSVAVLAKTTGGTKGDLDARRKKQLEKQKMRQLLEKTPIISRLLDGPLIMGDAVMMAATELSSTRIHWDGDLRYLLGVMVGSWFLAAFALGDYRGMRPSSENLFIQAVLGSSFIAFLDATVTWAVAAIMALASYTFLVNHTIIDPAALMDGLGTDDLSPQLEVAVAALITMPCWRGIAARIRS